MSSFESSMRFLRDVLLGSKMPKYGDLGGFSLFNLLSSQVGGLSPSMTKEVRKGREPFTGS